MSGWVLHHYTACGLPNIWIQCRHVVDDAGNDTFIISNIKGLHKEIARTVVHSDGALTGAELKFLRSEMGMTPAELGELVHRRGATISRWEREESMIDSAVEAFIRILASTKLELNKVDPEEIIGKCTPTQKPKGRIKIEMQNSKRYRLAA